ncbi:DNA topoisomerase 1-like [Aedes albopictus]|uniref:ZAD domain-containing protein n=1 Tax=Aedes albopictus TaxID=7160 RepID=A0ABM1XYR7_AEDAL
MDSGSSHRARRSRTAEVCRLCLKKRYLVDIDCNQYLCMQLKECFPHLSPDDSELPRFVCGECYQLVEITYQFIIRARRTEVLLRSYVHMGGDFPNEGTLEAEYRRRPKRSASPEKDSQEENPASKKRRSSEESSKKRRSSEESSNSKKDNERNSSKHIEEEGKDSSKHRDDSKRESTKHKEKDSSRHKQTSNRSSSSSKRKEKEGYTNKNTMLPTKAMTEAELKRYHNSDEYLFGGAVDLEPVKTQNDRVEEIQPPKYAAIRMESVASNLKGISLKMSYEEMANVLTALQTIQNGQTVSI